MVSIRDILLLAAVAVSLPFSFLRPAFGILVWTILGFLNPQAFTWGIAREAPLAQMVAVPTLAGFIVEGGFQRLWRREVGLLAILWLWFTVTTIYGSQSPVFAHKAAFSWYRWGFVSKILLMTAVTIAVIDTRERLRWLVLAVGGSFGVLVIKTLPGMIVYGGRFRIYGPDHSMIGDNNAFGLAVNMALPFLFYLAKTTPTRWVKWFLGAAFLAGIPAVFFTYSRGAFVGLVAMSAAMVLASRQRLLLIPVLALASLFGTLVAPQAWRDRMGNAANPNEASAHARIISWQFCWDLVNSFPITGGGFEAFTPELYAMYGPDPNGVHGPHSIYFGVLAEHGFVGFGLYLTLVGYCFMSLRSITKEAHLRGDEESEGYANMLRFSLVGFLSSGAFLGHTYFDFYFMIVACLAILRQVCRDEWALSDDEADDDSGVDLATIPKATCAGASQ